MKLFVFVLCVVGLVQAEPPRFRSSFLQRQEQEESSAPYAPSGSRPSGAIFRLPERQTQTRTIYGPPTEVPTTEPSTEETTTMDSTTLEPSYSQLKEKNAKPENDDVEEVEQVQSNAQKPFQEGVYYILLPTGQLQRVDYLTNLDDAKKMAYTTKLKYVNVEPIKAPVFAYNPNLPFLRVAF